MIVPEKTPKYRTTHHGMLPDAALSQRADAASYSTTYTHTLVARAVPIPCDERAGAIPAYMVDLDAPPAKEKRLLGMRRPHPGRGAQAWRGASQAALAFTIAAGWLVLLVGTGFSGIVVALGLLIVLAVLK